MATWDESKHEFHNNDLLLLTYTVNTSHHKSWCLGWFYIIYLWKLFHRVAVLPLLFSYCVPLYSLRLCLFKSVFSPCRCTQLKVPSDTNCSVGGQGVATLWALGVCVRARVWVRLFLFLVQGGNACRIIGSSYASVGVLIKCLSKLFSFKSRSNKSVS